MERRLLHVLRRHLRQLGRRRTNLLSCQLVLSIARFASTDATIVEVYMWAVINDRPTCWACRAENWRGVTLPPGLPSPSQMSRRLRSRTIRLLLDRLERWVWRQRRSHATLACAIDGHAMEIAPHSGDRQAGYGRARGGQGKGYKLHMLIDLSGTVWAWRVAAMNVAEPEMARRILRDLPPTAYVLADTNYNSNRLFELVRLKGAQLVSRRKERNAHQGLGHRPQDPGRLRSVAMLEHSPSHFGSELLHMRGRIEGFFGTLTSHANGLFCLQPWARTYARVRRWAQAKIILNQVRTQLLNDA